MPCLHRPFPSSHPHPPSTIAHLVFFSRRRVSSPSPRLRSPPPSPCCCYSCAARPRLHLPTFLPPRGRRDQGTRARRRRQIRRTVAVQEGAAAAAVVTATWGKEVRKGKGTGRKRRWGRGCPCRRNSLSPTPRSSEVMLFPLRGQSDPLQSANDMDRVWSVRFLMRIGFRCQSLGWFEGRVGRFWSVLCLFSRACDCKSRLILECPVLLQITTLVSEISTLLLWVANENLYLNFLKCVLFTNFITCTLYSAYCKVVALLDGDDTCTQLNEKIAISTPFVSMKCGLNGKTACGQSLQFDDCKFLQVNIVSPENHLGPV
jgi:hypothetical protein